MSLRSGLLGLAGVFAVAGAAAARPAIDPQDVPAGVGQPDEPMPALGQVSASRTSYKPGAWAASPLVLPGDLLAGVRELMLNRLTIPLGPAEVQE